MGTVIAEVFATQWVFMLIAAVAVAATFLVKKFTPDFYQNFLKGGLVVLVLLLVVLALLVHAPDLFLLIPIIIMCCELFGYGVTGKVVGVLFVDFILIQIDYKFITNITVNTIIFYILQIAAAICIGIIMDKYVRELQAAKRDGKELTNEELKQLDDEIQEDSKITDIDADDVVVQEQTDDIVDIDVDEDIEKEYEDISDDELDSHVDEILNNINIDK